MVMCQKLLYRIQLPYTISFLRRIFERNIDEEYYVLIIQFINGSKIYSTILPCQIYETLHCCMLWHSIRDSSALLPLLFYEQFSTVLKPIMTLVAEISARWQCQHTFPDSDRTTFRRFLTALFSLYYLLPSVK